MAETIASSILLLVVLQLLLSIWRQFNFLGPRGQIADSFGILPQWKFFALSNINTRVDNFDDCHLLTRLAVAGSGAGPWQTILCDDERKWFHIAWNPYLRAAREIKIQMMNIVSSGDAAQPGAYQMSLSYLTVVRLCIDHADLHEDQALQFAIVTSRGRADRPVVVRYLSAWHRP